MWSLRYVSRQTDGHSDTHIAILSTANGGEVKLDAADKSSELNRNLISVLNLVMNSLVRFVYFRERHASLKPAVNFRRSQLLTIDRHGKCIRR